MFVRQCVCLSVNVCDVLMHLWVHSIMIMMSQSFDILLAYTLQGLLETQLADQPFSSGELLSDYLRLFQANTDAAVVKMLQVKLLIPVSCELVWLDVRNCVAL